MKLSYSGGDSNNLPLSGAKAGAKFKSVRRVFRIMELVSHQGEDLTAKQIAHEIGTNLSSCYYLLGILTDEGYVEKLPHRGGYRIGPTVSLLSEGSRSGFDSKIEPVVEELAQRARRRAYSAVLSAGEMEGTQVKAPPNRPPRGVGGGG